MRRDYFSLEVERDDTSGLPTVQITFEGPPEGLLARLAADSGEPLDAGEVDVTYRLQNDETGVFGITNRVTGEFILELNADKDVVFGLIRAAREQGTDDEHYRLTISTEDERLLDHDKRTLLVYDADGELLRADSLIPNGVEL